VGGAAPDYPAAAAWFERAATAGHELAANNLCNMYTVGRGREVIENKHATDVASPPPPLICLFVCTFTHMVVHAPISVECCFSVTLLRGVTRSKRRALQWMRKAAENGHLDACCSLAACMYDDRPHAREVGHWAEAAGVAAPAGCMEGHDLPPDVLTSVFEWLRKGCVTGHRNPLQLLEGFRKVAQEGGKYCFNETCEVLGRAKDFKVCPQCKTARYCGDACQKEHWTTGGHKEKCGTSASHVHR